MSRRCQGANSNGAPAFSPLTCRKNRRANSSTRPAGVRARNAGSLDDVGVAFGPARIRQSEFGWCGRFARRGGYIMRWLIVLLMFFASTASVAAQEKFVTYGTLNCGEYVQAREEQRRRGSPTIESDKYLAWLAGFLTGVNFGWHGGLEKDLGPVPIAGHLAWLENHCRAKPLNSLTQGAMALVGELRQRK